jgi:predicted metalloprotease with PDZ domain
MTRALVLIVAAVSLLLVGARRPPSVDYRLGFDLERDGAPVATVEMRFEGDADGETRLDLPDRFRSTQGAWRYVFDLDVRGARVAAPDPAHRVLTHRPGAKITVRYRVQSAYADDPQAQAGDPIKGPLLRPQGAALLGPLVLATPEGRDLDRATFRWGRLPRGWRGASDLEHAEMGRWMNVADVRDSVTLAGPDLEVVERDSNGARLRIARLGGPEVEAAASAAMPVLAAQNAYWAAPPGPELLALVGLAGQGGSAGGDGFLDGFALYAPADATGQIAETTALRNLESWIPARLGRVEGPPAATAWFAEGVSDFLAARILLRAGIEQTPQAVERLGGSLYVYDHSPVRAASAAKVAAGWAGNADLRQLARARGALLALKWDEDVRQKTGGKADFDDVLVRMRDHYRQFRPGEGPDLVTSLISAAWVTAKLDLRPDLDRYVTRGEPIELPAEMFGGCVQARVTTQPAFDLGFDVEASMAAHTVKGVRRRGPAWNSGLRDGMRLESWRYQSGDTSRQVEFTVRTGRGRHARARTIAYWPYGDEDTVTRKLQLTPGLSEAEVAACGRRLAGL